MRKPLSRLAAWLSDLQLAIVLLLLIALASAIGTAIPQGDAPGQYIEAYADARWLGLLNGQQVLLLQLDHVYSSNWFLLLLAWLGISLILCSWRRQWPALQAARLWVDYGTPRQLSKLAIAESITCSDPEPTLIDSVSFSTTKDGNSEKLKAVLLQEKECPGGSVRYSSTRDWSY